MAVEPDKFVQVRGFRVEIESAGGKETDTAWEIVAGGECHLEVADCDDATHQHAPGKRYVGEIVLRGPMTDTRAALCQWLNEAATGQDTERARRTLRITPILRRRGQIEEGRPFIYTDCFPVGYVFPRLSVTNTTGNVQEEVRIKPVRCELK